VNNFGGALQAYALYRILAEQQGVEPVVIDYRNRFITFTDAVRMFPITKNLQELVSGLRTMELRQKRRRLFQHFIGENMVLTRTYYSAGALEKAPPECAHYVCGSDQIWNPVITGGVDRAYYLAFAPAGKGRIAYAPSFGLKSLPVKDTAEIKTLLTELDCLSIREKTSAEIIQSLTGKEAEVLIDPTFLLERETWAEIARVPPVPEKYILLYIMQNDSTVYHHVEIIKKKTGLPVVAVSRYGYRPPCVDQVLVDVGPAEFVGLCANAEIVCTNSYHGLIFSLIFEKKLYLVPSKRFKGRMIDLLRLLENDAADCFETPGLIDVDVDTEKMDKILQAERERSIAFLRRSLGAVE